MQNNWKNFLSNIPSDLISENHKKLMINLMDIAEKELVKESPFYVYYNEEDKF